MIQKLFSQLPRAAQIGICIAGPTAFVAGFGFSHVTTPTKVVYVEDPRPDLLLPLFRVFNQFRSIWRGKVVDTDAVLDSDSYLLSSVVRDVANYIRLIEVKPILKAATFVAASAVVYQAISAFTAPPAGSIESLRLLRRTTESRSWLNTVVFYFSFQRARERAALRELLLREENRVAESSHWLSLSADERMDMIIDEVSRPSSRYNAAKKIYAGLLLTELIDGKVVDTESNSHDITVALQRIVTQHSLDLENDGRLVPSSGNQEGLSNHAAWLASGGEALSRPVLNAMIRDAVRSVAPAKLVRPGLNGQQGLASAAQSVVGLLSWQRVCSATGMAAKSLGTVSQFLGIRTATE